MGYKSGSAFIFVVIGILVIGFVGGYYYFRAKDQLQPSATLLNTPVATTYVTPRPSPSQPTMNPVPPVSDLCNFKIVLPTGYHLQEPINSFFGNTKTKNDAGDICKVILGPHYQQTYEENINNHRFEGYIGEQIQVNVYPASSTSVAEIMKVDNSTKSSIQKQSYRYTRPSYGGEDEVLIFQHGKKIYQIIWRNDPSNIEDAAGQIASQL